MLRTRTRSVPAVIGTHRNYKNGVFQGKISDTVMSERSSTMSDTVTPNYAKLIQAGVIINNNASMIVTERTTSGSGNVVQAQIASPYAVWTANGSGTITGYYIKYAGGWPAYTPVSLSDLSGVINTVKQQCIAGIDKTPFAFGEDVAEMQQTLRFLKHPATSLYELSRSFSREAFHIRRRFTAIADVTKALANLWLTYRFAVSPLVRSSLQVVEAFKTKTERPKRRTSRSNSEVPHRQDAKLVSKSNAGRTLKYWCQSSAWASVRAGILYEVSNPIADIRFKTGLRFKDIPVTIWQVVPYSFMIDRMVNITNFVGGVANLLDPNVRILAAWVTEHTETTVSYGVQSIQESGYTSVIGPDAISDRTFEYSRSVWSPTWVDTLPNPDIRGLVNSASKLTDLFSLAIQNFKS